MRQDMVEGSKSVSASATIGGTTVTGGGAVTATIGGRTSVTTGQSFLSRPTTTRQGRRSDRRSGRLVGS